jgi:HEAT repeat protein
LRPGTLVLALLLGASAFAEDARVKILQKQLSTAKDARLRAQISTLLGKTGSEDAVAPLCVALNDAEAIVRSAAAGGLGELKAPDGMACLKNAKDDPDPQVRKAVELAIAANKPPGGLYVAIDTINNEAGAASDVVSLAKDILKQKLTSMGAKLAPEGETESQAASVISKGGFKGYLLRTNLKTNGASGLKIEILIMTYPAKALQGTWNVKASGGKPEAQLKAMVPKVVENAAEDLEWQ